MARKTLFFKIAVVGLNTLRTEAPDAAVGRANKKKLSKASKQDDLEVMNEAASSRGLYHFIILPTVELYREPPRVRRKDLNRMQY